MNQRRSTIAAVLVASLGAAGTARAEEAASPRGVRVHVAAGAAHALGTPQGREFGTGGGGTAAVELPLGAALGAQASVGALVLSKGESPADPGVQPTGTGIAGFGTLGLRYRAWGARAPAGPWIDANGGVAGTGTVARPVVSAHLGWEMRIARSSRWDAGPFLGYSQIVQPAGDLRSNDARVLWAGISVSLGAPERAYVSPPSVEPALPLPAPPAARPDQDGFADAYDTCPGEAAPVSEADRDGGCVGDVRIVEDRIVLGDVILFDFDSPRIRSRSHRLVHKIADVILAAPEVQTVSIEGHADAVGTDAYNQHLSLARAESTRTMLVHFGVPTERLVVVAHGKGRLKVQTARPHQGNRRVELIVSRRRELREVSKESMPAARGAGERGQP